MTRYLNTSATSTGTTLSRGNSVTTMYDNIDFIADISTYCTKHSHAWEHNLGTDPLSIFRASLQYNVEE